MIKENTNPSFENPNPEMMTPEEKLFRLISAVNRQDANMEELIEKYAPGKTSKPGQKFWQQSGELWGEGLKRLEAGGLKFLEVLRSQPRWIPALILGVFAFVIWVFAATLKSEKNFYFYGDAASSKAAAEISSEKSTAAVVVRATEEAPYKLVGISWEEGNRVAMIEVSSDQRARFVRKGDTLPGGAKVLEVKEYSVQLSQDHRKWELS